MADLGAITLTSPPSTPQGAVAEVYLHGAHITSFKTASGKVGAPPRRRAAVGGGWRSVRMAPALRRPTPACAHTCPAPLRLPPRT